MTVEGKKNKEDTRVQRTRNLLSQGLRSLLLEKPFEDIFVTDICDRAKIHRTTFYKHFEDKYHLLDFCVKELIHTFEEESLSISLKGNRKDHYIDLIRKSLEFMMANKELLSNGILNAGNNSALPMLYRSVSSLLESKLIKAEELGVRHEVPLPIMAQFYSGAFISASIWWLETGTPLSVDEMVHYIDLLIRDS